MTASSKSSNWFGRQLFITNTLLKMRKVAAALRWKVHSTLVSEGNLKRALRVNVEALPVSPEEPVTLHCHMFLFRSVCKKEKLDMSLQGFDVINKLNVPAHAPPSGTHFQFVFKAICSPFLSILPDSCTYPASCCYNQASAQRQLKWNYSLIIKQTNTETTADVERGQTERLHLSNSPHRSRSWSQPSCPGGPTARSSRSQTL